MVFNMRKNKILFVFEHCKHNNNKILTIKNLLFLSIISFTIFIRLFKLIIKNKSNKNIFDMNSLKDIKKNYH